uniref:Protein amnionless n=1 Tax=Cacopsylla melanoneura TaxID=428564 RepID=A0A8D9EVJ4_9HEMI
MILLILISVTFFCYANADIKTWIGPTTAFPNITHTGSKILFDGAYDFPIEINNNIKTDVCEIVLPNEGEIVFGTDFSMTIGGGKERNGCVQNEAKVISIQNRAYWLDLKNWFSSKVNMATPDLEQLPCSGDTVVFPADTVYLYTPNILVNKLTINNQQMSSQNSFNEFVSSETGSKMFALDPLIEPQVPNTRPVIMHSPPCELQGGCVCLYHSQDDVDNSNVCHVMKQRCIPKPPCTTPILPYGNCCPICGAQLLFKSTESSSFNLTQIKQQVEVMVSKFSAKYKPVDVHISRSFYSTIQIVLVEQGDYEGYVGDLSESIMEMVTSVFSLQLVPYRPLLHSGFSYNPHGGPNILQTMFISFILSMAVLGVIYVHYYLDGWSILGLEVRSFLGLGRSNDASAFVFKRFDNERKEEPMVYEVTPRVPTKPTKAFDNPMYNVESAESTIQPAEESPGVTQSFQELKQGKYEEASDED